jgi:single-strand DNA-binding protein
MNQVGMIGRFTKDPILRQLSEGRVQASFVLAVSRTFKSQKVKMLILFYVRCGGNWQKIPLSFVGKAQW